MRIMGVEFAPSPELLSGLARARAREQAGGVRAHLC